MKIEPCYLYGIDNLPEVNDGSLFHFTKFKSLKKILKKMTLRSSPLYKMNDLNEADLSGLNWNENFLLMHDTQNYARFQCSLICFSQNYDDGYMCREGANHPAMWAYYAENSEGVCIVLDKVALLENNSDRLNDVFHRLEEVEYTTDHAPRVDVAQCEYTSASEFIHKNYREVFFKKDIVWKSEGEIRLLVESPTLYLNILGAVKYIVLGQRLINNDKKMRELVSIIYSSDILKNYLEPHSFATFAKSQGGYLIHDASYHIEMYRRELNNLSK